MENLTNVVSGNLGKALEEVDKLLRNPRTRVEIITLGRQMKSVVAELGARTLELYKQGRVGDPELAELCARIVSIEARIAEREARLAIEARSEGQAAQPPAAAAANESVPCPRCKTPLPAGAVFCFKCGLKIESTPAVAPAPDGNFCSNCGRELRPGAKFCPRCGTTI